MPSKTLTLVPTYGRDYKTAAEVEAAFHGGKDFRICDIGCSQDGAAASFAELKGAGYTHACIRYNRLADFVVIEV